MDFVKLLAISETEHFQTGDIMFSQGDMNSFVRVVANGDFKCLVDGIKTYNVEGGNFIAEGGLHAGAQIHGPMKVSGTLVATVPSICFKFDRTALVELLEDEPSLKKSLQSALSWDIVKKLKSQRQVLAKGGIDLKEQQKWSSARNRQTEVSLLSS